ncbi:hypothetical protein GCM10025734_26810 [Kitasatospora paranensis]
MEPVVKKEVSIRTVAELPGVSGMVRKRSSCRTPGPDAPVAVPTAPTTTSTATTSNATSARRSSAGCARPYRTPWTPTLTAIGVGAP